MALWDDCEKVCGFPGREDRQNIPGYIFTQSGSPSPFSLYRTSLHTCLLFFHPNLPELRKLAFAYPLCVVKDPHQAAAPLTTQP